MATTSPVKLGKTFLEETFSLRLVDIDQEREAAERRFPSQHGQQIGGGLERAGPDLGNRQAEAARECRGSGPPPAVFRADDHRQRTRALPQSPGQCFDALVMALWARPAVNRRDKRGNALVDGVLTHQVSGDALVDHQMGYGRDRTLRAVDQLKSS